MLFPVFVKPSDFVKPPLQSSFKWYTVYITYCIILRYTGANPVRGLQRESPVQIRRDFAHFADPMQKIAVPLASKVLLCLVSELDPVAPCTEVRRCGKVVKPKVRGRSELSGDSDCSWQHRSQILSFPQVELWLFKISTSFLVRGNHVCLRACFTLFFIYINMETLLPA